MSSGKWRPSCLGLNVLKSFQVNTTGINFWLVIIGSGNGLVPSGSNLLPKPMLNQIMMTPSNEHIFRVTGPLCGKFTGHPWISLTKASDAELWCFLWCTSEQTAEQTVETPVIWDAIALIITPQ